MKTAKLLAPFALLALVFTVSSCKKKGPVKVDPAFAQYIVEFTTGQVSATGEIAVRFRDDVAMKDNTNERPAKEVFSFEPSLAGHSYWADERTIIFKPEKAMPRGTQYNVALQVDAIAEVPKEFAVFRFPFTVLEQHINAEVGPLEISAMGNTDVYRMEVSVHSTDGAGPDDATKMLTATLDGRALKINYTSSGNGTLHQFSIDSIARQDKRGQLVLNWDGAPIDAPEKGETERVIPSFADFSVLSVEWMQNEDAYIHIVFSDPIKENQNLDGLVSVENASVSLVVESNRIKAYPDPIPTEDAIVTVSKGITNTKGYKLEDDFTYTINFRPLTPDIRWIHKTGGNILPSSNGMVFPFEAVSLRAVDVKIIKVFENNIPQFLQVNRMEGQREVKRVGKVVAQRILRLDQQPGTNLRKWNRFYLDLEKYIKTEPGAIYRIELNFNKNYAITDCGGTVEPLTDEQPTPEQWTYENSENSYWDYYDEYYYYDYYEGENSAATDPCNDEYYYNKRGIQTNVLSSDLGLLFKKGQGNEALACVTDLISAGPMTDCQVEILDFQLQSLFKAKTDSRGNMNIKLKEGEVPFLMVATKGKQKGYLRLDYGTSLSTSKFDVSGSATQSGMKGYIYGERGVWRPGDTLFVSFMLHDRAGSLPVGHPLVLELFNPRGQKVTKQVQNLNENGHHTFVLKTDEDAITGNYTANIKAGGAYFLQNLRIETVKPNRLKVELDFGGEEIKADQTELKAKLKTRWLHGAVARNMKAEVTSVFRPKTTEFPKYKGFSFDDPTRGFASSEEIVFDGNVNEKGEAEFKLETNLNGQAPGKVDATFSTRVFEGPGDFSVDQMTISLSPYEDYVGVKLPKGDEMRGMLLTDVDHSVETVLLSEDGKPQPNRQLEWKLYKVHWRWWWEQGQDNLSRWNSDEGYENINGGTVTTNSKGQAKFKIRVDSPEWGRYLVRVTDTQNGHSAGKTTYIDWPGWAGRGGDDNAGGATMLLFSADKETYAPGQKCRLTFPSTVGSRALISIENGAGILQHEWIQTTDKQTAYEFTVTEAMAPNVYAAITLVQPHAQTLNNLPIRLYGVIPIKVEDPNTRLSPIIQMPDKLEPEKKFTVKVSEKSGRAMSYTVAIVDEGLLDLTRFKTPDPWKHFYAREAHGVMMWDLYDQVIGAFGGTVERLLSIGGDGENIGGGKKKAERFKPVVMFSGPHTLNKGQTGTHTFTMPNYVGSVRAMVVAREKGAFGNAEKTVAVKKPLMTLATLPRTLSPGDKVKLPVTVFAMESNIKDVDVQVKTSGPVKMTTTKTNLRFDAIGDLTTEFEFDVLPKAGVAVFEVVCTSGKEKASHKIEVQVRNPNPPETDSYNAIVPPGETWEQSFDLRGIEGSNAAVLEVSAFALRNSEKRLRYLIGYPHGCLEQTLSKAFPQLYLADVMELNDQTVKRTRSYVQEGINKVVRMQTGEGGMSYWPGTGQVHDWSSSYVLHFFTEAQAKGFSVPASALNKLIEYQQNTARKWVASGSDEFISNASYQQAYRLYTLALAGKADLSSMNRMKQENNLPVAATWMLAGAYAKAGQTKTGKALVLNLGASVKDYRESYMHFGSGFRDMALIYLMMVDLGEKAKAAPLAKAILDGLNDERWLSTNETSYALMAATRMMMNEKGKSLKYEAQLNGKKAGTYGTSRPMAQIPLEGLKLKGNKVSIKNTGSGPMYVSVAVTGQPTIGNETDKSNNMALSITYTDRAGKAIDLSRIEQGTDILCNVTVQLTGPFYVGPNMALTQVFPSGFEIRNARMDAGAASYTQDAFDYQDIRDDRALTYFGMYGRSKINKYVLVLHAAYQGTYYLPSVTCESMYDPNLAARVKGRTVQIVKSNGAVASAE